MNETCARETRSELFSVYKSRPTFFPLIGAVIEQAQTGVLLADRIRDPGSFFICHRFGFCQFVETEENRDFDRSLESLISAATSSSLPAKLRVYDPPEKWRAFFGGLRGVQEGVRSRYIYQGGEVEAEAGGLSEVAVDNLPGIRAELDADLPQRFWDNETEMVAKSLGVVTIVKGRVASICYAAAVSDGRAEVDIVTAPGVRRTGLAKLVGKGFVNRCLRSGIVPVWDCYRDNEASRRTALSLGFTHVLDYPFCIVNRAALN